MTGKQVFFGAVGAAAIFALSWFLPAGVIALSRVTLWSGAPDANIGAGLLLLAIPAAVIPLGLWWLLRRLEVPGAAVIGAGGIAVYVATVMVSTERTFWDPLFVIGVVGAVAFLVYAGLAVLLAGVVTRWRGTSGVEA